MVEGPFDRAELLLVAATPTSCFDWQAGVARERRSSPDFLFFWQGVCGCAPPGHLQAASVYQEKWPDRVALLPVCFKASFTSLISGFAEFSAGEEKRKMCKLQLCSGVFLHRLRLNRKLDSLFKYSVLWLKNLNKFILKYAKRRVRKKAQDQIYFGIPARNFTWWPESILYPSVSFILLCLLVSGANGKDFKDSLLYYIRQAVIPMAVTNIIAKNTYTLTFCFNFLIGF